MILNTKCIFVVGIFRNVGFRPICCDSAHWRHLNDWRHHTHHSWLWHLRPT